MNHNHKAKRLRGRRVRNAAVAAALAAALALALPSSAFAVTVADLFVLGPIDFIAAFLTEIIMSAVQTVLVPLCQVMFNWGTDFLSIPMVNRVIIALQGFALVAAVAVRISVGVSEGIFLRGGNKERSNGEYIFKSIVALALVALMPMICRTIIQLGIAISNGLGFGDGGENSIAVMLEYFTLGDNFNWSEVVGDTSITAGVLWTIIGLLAMLILAIACGYQFIRRQVEMLVVSIIAPLVSIYAATENDSDQVWNMLRQLFGLVCMQWLQYLLVVIAMNFGIAWIEQVFATSDLLPFTEVPATYFMFCLATFGAALTIPDLVNRYTFGNGGSRTGGLVTSFAVNRAMGGVAKLGGKMAHRATGAAAAAAGGTVKATSGAVSRAWQSRHPGNGPDGGPDGGGSGAAAGDTGTAAASDSARGGGNGATRGNGGNGAAKGKGGAAGKTPEKAWYERAAYNAGSKIGQVGLNKAGQAAANSARYNADNMRNAVRPHAATTNRPGAGGGHGGGPNGSGGRNGGPSGGPGQAKHAPAKKNNNPGNGKK